jgi:mono/diheme cytochrome c family protein
VNCHALKMDNAFKAPTLATIPKDGWAKGCMGADEAARGKAPDFGLSAGQREALLAFAATDRTSLRREALPEFAERQIAELRCIACHSRDTKLDVWDEVIKETEPLAKGDAVDPQAGAANGKALPGEMVPGTGDQSRPPLTWAGEKLYPEWMSTFIAGKLDYKPRVWMLARMPGFPARAQGIAQGLALEHGCPAATPDLAKADEELAKIGKQLVGRNGGFSCIQCHGVAKIAPISPFEAPSLNFKYAKERIRREYYDRWMRNPQRVIPNTKMPSFAKEDGKTALTDILEGDAAKQFDAIWNYLQAGREIEHPEQEQGNP